MVNGSSWSKSEIKKAKKKKNLKKNLIIIYVRTGFDLNPKRKRIQAHVAQTMNLYSAGKKASLILGQNIGF